jgi:deoxyribonuclease IV
MNKYGLKLWSTNRGYVKEALSLYERAIFDYIELTVVPDSYEECIGQWKNLEIPYVIHGPHSELGVNLARREGLEKNLICIEEAFHYADILKAEKIIFHSGINGSIKETEYQLRKRYDPRMVIENKPYYTIRNDGSICAGNSPGEIKYLIDTLNVGFCLDIAHAICAARARNVTEFDYIKEFIDLSPSIYHLTDGHSENSMDQHLHFGEGNYRIREIMNLLPDNVSITIESVKSSDRGLEDFEKDLMYLKRLESENPLPRK